MSVRIYVEGGGQSNSLKTECRRGFAEFFAKFIPPGKQPRIIACGSRNDALSDFRTALKMNHQDHVVLLVDAEAALAPGQSIWTHLKQRDGWEPPPGATDENTHLMVQCMESWFLADPAELGAYFGQGFQATALPGNKNIEGLAKQDVFRALEHATRQAHKKGFYSKGGHSFALLARIDPAKVRNASPQAERLAGFLLRLCV